MKACGCGVAGFKVLILRWRWWVELRAGGRRLLRILAAAHNIQLSGNRFAMQWKLRTTAGHRRLMHEVEAHQKTAEAIQKDYLYHASTRSRNWMGMAG